MAKGANSDPIQSPAMPSLVMAIVRDDEREVAKLLAESPSLARECLLAGATQAQAVEHFFEEIHHYLYAGDTPLHAAAAGYRRTIAMALVERGAGVNAQNRRGAAPLHYAADGNPVFPEWNPDAQAAMISYLIECGAYPNMLDKSGVAPLHRAVRQRCPKAVDSLLRGGAFVRLKNKSGSTPLHLAVQNTGRGGTGSPEAKSCQAEIIGLLLKAGADRRDKDGSGRTAVECAQSEWIQALL